MFVAFVLGACGGRKEKVNEPVQETVQTGPQLRRMNAYDLQDSIRMGSNKMVYTLHRDGDESQPMVTDENGDKHVDNFYELTIKKNGADFFSQRFTKASFKSMLDADFMKNGILDGFRYNRCEDGKLLFSICVSYPDSDMSAPFILTIGPDGSHSLRPDDVLDVEEVGDTTQM